MNHSNTGNFNTGTLTATGGALQGGMQQYQQAAAISVYDKIREVITDYGVKSISLQQFRERFIPLLQQSSKSDAQTVSVAFEVESAYADVVAGVLTEEQFTGRLYQIAPYVPNQAIISSGFMGTASGNEKAVNLNLQSAPVSADKSYLNNLELTACGMFS